MESIDIQKMEMFKSIEDCKRDTQEHINYVGYFIEYIRYELLNRMINHDKTKLEEPELPVFATYGPKLKDSTYGSEEYKQFLKEMKYALDHHYCMNRHHPEYFVNGIKDMNLIDIVEMICDWYAASSRHDNGNIFNSIEINQERFGYSDELKSILINTAKLLHEIRLQKSKL